MPSSDFDVITGPSVRRIGHRHRPRPNWRRSIEVMHHVLVTARLAHLSDPQAPDYRCGGAGCRRMGFAQPRR